MLKKYWWHMTALVGIGAWAFGQGLEVFGQWPACRLCHIERWLFLLMGILGLGRLFFSKMHGAIRWEKRCAWAAMSTMIIGASVAAYHTAIQFHWIGLPEFCQLPDADTFHQFMALPTARCDQWTMTFLRLPMPVYLFFLWLAMACMTYVGEQKARSKNW